MKLKMNVRDNKITKKKDREIHTKIIFQKIMAFPTNKFLMASNFKKTMIK